MARLFGFVALLACVAVGMYIYSRQIQAVTPGGTGAAPKMTVNIVGVQQDLLAIAGAERRHFATEGKYVSVDDLASAGDLAMKRNSRGPYTYDANISDSGFTITATYSGEPQPGVPRVISIDNNMEIHRSE